MNELLARKVLLLNKLYTPISIITARSAFIKLFTEVAEVVTVEEGNYANYDFSSWAEISELREQLEELGDLDDVVYTARLSLIVPRVIRLLEYDKIPAQVIKLTRRNIYARDENRCQYCGERFVTDKLNLDHVKPKAQGGHNAWENLVCSCLPCNTRKANRTPEQAGMKLIRTPKKPMAHPMLRVHISHQRYEAWTSFISEGYWNTELID